MPERRDRSTALRFCVGDVRRRVLCFVSLAAGLMSSSPAVAVDAADTQLEIEIRRSPDAAAEHYVLRCSPPGGTVRNPTAACQRIADAVATGTTVRESGPAKPSRDGAIINLCSQIYGGPEVARIRGRWLGGPIDARLTRENGCTMSSFDATMELLGVPSP
jgi:hypothetical protein